MTHSHADPADLVAVVRQTLVEQLLPDLPEPRRHAALMAAHALGVAERALEVNQVGPGGGTVVSPAPKSFE